VYRSSVGFSYDEIVAVVTSIKFSPRIDIHLRNGEPLRVHRTGFFASTHTLDMKEAKWKWKREGFLKSVLTLSDETNSIVATCQELSTWPGNSIGMISIFGNYRQPKLNIIIATCLAKIGYRRLLEKLK
jgi:hypothetical protein